MLLIKIPHHATLRSAVRNSEMKYCVALRVLLATCKTEFTRYARSRSYSATHKTTSLRLLFFMLRSGLAWLRQAKPLLSKVTLKQKVTSQQRLGFFSMKNPSNAQVGGHEAVAEVYADAAQ
jgi:hypothetical protein